MMQARPSYKNTSPPAAKPDAWLAGLKIVLSLHGTDQAMVYAINRPCRLHGPCPICERNLDIDFYVQQGQLRKTICQCGAELRYNGAARPPTLWERLSTFLRPRRRRNLPPRTIRNFGDSDRQALRVDLSWKIMETMQRAVVICPDIARLGGPWRPGEQMPIIPHDHAPVLSPQSKAAQS